jgi:hypothetical protein
MSPRLLQKRALRRDCYCLGTCGSAKLIEHGGKMVVHSAGGEKEPSRNILVCKPLRDQSQYLLLPGAQEVVRCDTLFGYVGSSTVIAANSVVGFTVDGGAGDSISSRTGGATASRGNE